MESILEDQNFHKQGKECSLPKPYHSLFLLFFHKHAHHKFREIKERLMRWSHGGVGRHMANKHFQTYSYSVSTAIKPFEAGGDMRAASSQ